MSVGPNEDARAHRAERSKALGAEGMAHPDAPARASVERPLTVR
jgi:hypothetical protein